MGVIIPEPDYATWLVRYPQFNPVGGSQPVSHALYSQYFADAQIYQANNGAGPITDATMATRLMMMLIAHIASMETPNASGASSSLVGRITSASEGSVSVSVENNYGAGTVQWYQQTKYGSDWWAATAQYRTMGYRPGPVMGVPANQTGYPGWTRGYR
jgi:hypothetical protein